MEKPDIVVHRDPRGYNFQIQGGNDPGLTVLNEFIEISEKHSLPPEGGCYNVNALTLDNTGTVSFLGGMYVQSSKYNAVVTDLQSKGYTIITP